MVCNITDVSRVSEPDWEPNGKITFDFIAACRLFGLDASWSCRANRLRPSALGCLLFLFGTVATKYSGEVEIAVIADGLTCSDPSRAAILSFGDREDDRLHAPRKHGCVLETVDDFKRIRDIGLVVGNFKVEPLIMRTGFIDIRRQNQFIMSICHLNCRPQITRLESTLKAKMVHSGNKTATSIQVVIA